MERKGEAKKRSENKETDRERRREESLGSRKKCKPEECEQGRVILFLRSSGTGDESMQTIEYERERPSVLLRASWIEKKTMTRERKRKTSRNQKRRSSRKTEVEKELEENEKQWGRKGPGPRQRKKREREYKWKMQMKTPSMKKEEKTSRTENEEFEERKGRKQDAIMVQRVQGPRLIEESRNR